MTAADPGSHRDAPAARGEAPDARFRPAAAHDADAVADVFLRSRKELVAFAPLAHPDADVREWVRTRLIPAGNTTVAVVDGRVVGFLSVAREPDGGWIRQLYLLPAWVGCGLGTRLLEIARDALGPPIFLYTFQDNTRARRFYEHRGFRPLRFSDGSTNEEKCPDVLYEWRPTP